MERLALMPKYEAYKDSGVEWLGDIPSSWELKPGFVAFSENKRSNKGMKENTVLSLSYGNIVVKPEEKLVGLVPESFETYQLVEPDDIIVRCTDLQNDKVSLRTGLAKNKGIITSAYLNLRVKNGFDARFLHYYLHALDTTKVLYKFGSGLRQNLSFLDFKRLPIFEIPEDTQKLIANYLEKKTAQVDDAIAIKEQQINLLKERKQIIIQQAVTQGLDPNVPMKDSGVDWIGKIPAHWEMKRVKNIFRLVMQPSEKNNDYELLSVYTDIGVKPRRELEERGNKASTTDGYWFVKKGDIVVNKLLAWMGAIGLSEYEGVTSPAYDILRPKLPINGFFYHYLFRSDFCSAELKRHSRGIMDMRLRLYFDRFGVVEVPYPPVDEQNEIIHSLETEMKEMDKGIEHLNTQIEKLKEYKTTLINSAVTGKIKITPEMVEQ
ncbi:Type I restriction-modification system, specificity subunit S [Vibrio cholerae]|nr:Type I restriction-modification system, specificity subunit S [Vibrio cholerae]